MQRDSWVVLGTSCWRNAVEALEKLRDLNQLVLSILIINYVIWMENNLRILDQWQPQKEGKWGRVVFLTSLWFVVDRYGEWGELVEECPLEDGRCADH